MSALVEMRGIHKHFGAVHALRGVDLALEAGEVLGLVGDNAAGKSTLMKILSGALRPDAGQILLGGAPVWFASPADARRRGIEMVYQDFALCPNLDVARNVFLGRWPVRSGIVVDRAAMQRDARAMLDRLRIDVPAVTVPVSTLSGGRRQSVAIARALSVRPRVLILDEPTANLSPAATGEVLRLVAELKRHEVGVILISHRIQEVFEIGDRVTVLKQGRHVVTRRVKDVTEDEIVEVIVAGSRASAGGAGPPAAP
ncbi:MAG: sugar ABC transporter ATP-binding protein [Bacillati bacterium ANGP1]|uniref:Sugar ABC transporter ATP-binding protein n=1 Tax=Candidatus Segetimicrobium genomatis TaxID=2569760 RepID=A0A537KBI4_9BACT|nr:MAG: sugar ABC transporter ATP-binding protein [Terrabacteria group bacterium ANGP1]